LALILFPDIRGYDAWMGWLPFWAVIAPMAALRGIASTRSDGGVAHGPRPCAAPSSATQREPPSTTIGVRCSVAQANPARGVVASRAS
jgi:hypothetical protein